MTTTDPTPGMIDAGAFALAARFGEEPDAVADARAVLTAALAAAPLRTGVTINVAPDVTLTADTPNLTATVDAPPPAVARLLRQLADDLDRQATSGPGESRARGVAS